MQLSSISEATIRAHSSPHSYSRGRSYYNRGAVAEAGAALAAETLLPFLERALL